MAMWPDLYSGATQGGPCQPLNIDLTAVTQACLQRAHALSCTANLGPFLPSDRVEQAQQPSTPRLTTHHPPPVAQRNATSAHQRGFNIMARRNHSTRVQECPAKEMLL